MHSSPWITRFSTRPGAAFTVVCLPYSGVGPSIFRTWAQAIRPDIEVWAIALPGHESRLREAPFVEVEPLIAELGPALAPGLAERPFAIFGHSLGALLAFELERWLETQRGLEAATLVASGAASPRTVRSGSSLWELPDAQFVAEVQRRYGGIPDAVLREPDFLELLVPTLRADFRLFATYRYRAGPALRCRLLVLCGADDATVQPEQVSAWREETSQDCEIATLPGGHLFLATERDRILRAIERRLG